MKNSRETLDKRNKLKREWFQKLKDTDFPKTILKVCSDCGELKEHSWSHSFTQTGVPEYRARCVDCRKKYLSTLRKSRRELLYEQRLKRVNVVREKCFLMLGGKCEKCGEIDFDVLTFHHINPNEKKYDVCKLIANGHSFENKKLQDELKKCKILCFNCHMKQHRRNKNV